jgi:hypothetical protein
MTPELARLAAQIAAAPGDVELQRIFADALLQAGGDHAIRGELIQLELAGQWGARAMELADSVKRAREGRGVGGLGRDGLARKWFGTAETFATFAAIAFEEEPLLHWVVITIGPNADGLEEMSKLAAVPELARVRDLYIAGNQRRSTRPGPEGVATLLASPHWPRKLDVLSLGTCGLGDAGAALLAESRCLSELRTLGLHDNGIGPDGVAALARSPIFAKLQTLVLDGNKPGQRGIEALVASKLPLKLLDLHRTGLTEDQLGLLAQRFAGIEIRYEVPDDPPEPDGDDDDFLKGPFV